MIHIIYKTKLVVFNQFKQGIHPTLDQNEIETNVFLPLDVPMTVFDEMLRVLNALYNQDSLAIFLYAKTGLLSAVQAIQDLRLTQKRYYSRLKDLLDVGLLEKRGGNYYYTTFGEAVSKLVSYLGQVLENKERLDLLDQINKNKSLSSSDVDQIKDLIFKQSGVLEGALHLILDGKNMQKVEVFSSYDVGVDILINSINCCSHRVLLASKYFDTKVIDATLKAHNRGVEFKVIMAKDNLTKKIEMLKLFLSPKLILSLVDFANDGAEKTVREFGIDYSYCIIDDTDCFFEFPPIDEKFGIGFFVTDKKINHQFSDLFKFQWEKAEAKEMPEFFKKLRKLYI